MDFPGEVPTMPTLSTFDQRYSPLARALKGSTSPASSALFVANRALYIPMTLDRPYYVTEVWWANGASVGGNVDVGVYTEKGSLLFSSGSTAQSGTTTIQVVTLGTAVLLTPGRYNFAIVTDTSVTNAYLAYGSVATVSLQETVGYAQQASNFPLGNAAFSPAAPAAANFPCFGVSNAPTL